MSKILILLFAACLACGIAAQSNLNACLNQCGSGCFVDSVGQRCRSCPAGCTHCRDPDTCLACSPGFYLNEESNCVECGVSGCANCTAQGVCTTCQSGYFLKNSSSCVYCGYLCEECESETRCKKCRNDADMYYGIYRSAKTGTCNYCPDGCKSCVSSGFCTSCKSGYALSDFQCITCSTIDPDCRTCDESITQCASCGPGRYLLNNACLECSSGCETCTDDSRCQKCMDGYFLNANGGCTPCMSSCKECKNSFTCDKCYEGSGYDAEKGRCMPCNLDCYGPTSPGIFLGGPAICGVVEPAVYRSMPMAAANVESAVGMTSAGEPAADSGNEAVTKSDVNEEAVKSDVPEDVVKSDAEVATKVDVVADVENKAESDSTTEEAAN